MNPQDLIRSIMTALDNIGSDEQPAQGTPEKMNVPTIAVLTPVKIDNTSSDGDGSKSVFTNVPDHAKQEEPEHSSCGCQDGAQDQEEDPIDAMKRIAGITVRAEQ
jgi:hypothetical protein